LGELGGGALVVSYVYRLDRWVYPKVGPEINCTSAKSVYFRSVKATLTQLRRDTAKVVRPVIHGGKKVTLTEHGQPCAEVIPLRKIDRRAACEDLMAIGPVEFLPRK
jgi:prevent-host-death family protein